MLMESPYHYKDGEHFVKVTEQQLLFAIELYDEFRLLTKEMTLSGLNTKHEKCERMRLAIAKTIEELRKQRREK